MQLKLTQDGLAPAATLAFIGSIQSAMLSFLALMSTRLVRVIGNRNAAFLGSCFLGGGWILSGWTVNSLPGLFITAGVIPGIGYALCFMVRVTRHVSFNCLASTAHSHDILGLLNSPRPVLCSTTRAREWHSLCWRRIGRYRLVDCQQRLDTARRHSLVVPNHRVYSFSCMPSYDDATEGENPTSHQPHHRMVKSIPLINALFSVV